MKEKYKVWLTCVVFLTLAFAGFYLIVVDGDKERAHNLQEVKNNYSVSKGIITKISSYKGHSVHIKYTINGKKYIYVGGYDNNSKNLGVDDSIKIKYAVDSPQYVISELDENYKTF